MINPRKKSISLSSSWNFLGYGAEAILRLGGNLILVRLVAPEAFGLMGLVNVIIVGFALFSDVGLQPSVVRSSRGDDKSFLSTIWTLQVLRGFVIFLTVCVSAGWIGSFYEQPILKELILLVALSAIADGFTSVGVSVATRHLDLKPVVILEVLTHAITIAAVIVFASIRGDVWALAVGSLIGRTTRALLSHILFRADHVGFGWDALAFKEIFGFGKWILLATALTFVSFQIDRIMLGKIVSWEQLGIYSILIAWAELPRVAMMKWSSQVFYPQISTWYRSPENFASSTRKLKGVILSIASLPMGIAIGLATPWIAMLYPEPYSLWGHLLAVMFIGMWIESMDVLYSQMFLTVNKPQIRSIGMVVSILVFVLLLLPVYNRYGLVGVAGLTVLARFARLMVQWYFAHRESLLFASQDIAHTLVVLVIAVAVTGAVKLASTVAGETMVLLSLTGVSIICSLLWLRLYWPKLTQIEMSH